MGKRWVICIVLSVLAVSLATAHKAPVMTFSSIGPYEFTFTHLPLQPVVHENLTLLAAVEQPGGGHIDGTIRMTFSVYDKVESTEWDGTRDGKRKPDWILIHESDGQPIGGNRFRSSLIIDRPGSYMVIIRVYENGLLLGRSMQHVDVEQRTIGPLFLALNLTVILGVLFGVRRGYL